ncbi:hypothetical protein HPB48_002071 [Haemaphysalis longicornis]|uniref:Uncharacterized protein n=1 Tax=Haemaphysalis longicornis TaxID=44386 RepID=A0A9J6FGK0_HAELO|nr:hypothetical protein HPB48_002071 [Haemaphysalis longicornis]
MPNCCTSFCTRRSGARPAEPSRPEPRLLKLTEMALENAAARRASPTRTVGRPSLSQAESGSLTGDGTSGAAAGGRSPSCQQQRSPGHSVRRKPRASPHRYHGSHSNGCASATASPLREASVSRSQSMRTTRRPHSLQRHFRDRIASIPGDLLMVNGASDSRGSSSSSLPCDELADVQRLRNFAVTSKGVVNRGDSFRSKSRSTHSVASTGSGHKLAVPGSSDVGADGASDAYCVCASLDGDRRVVSSLQQLSQPAEPAPVAARTERASFALACLESAGPSLSGLPPEVVVTRSAEVADLARYRILVLGAREVGKSSLINQFMTSEYIYAYDSSVATSPPMSWRMRLSGRRLRAACGSQDATLREEGNWNRGGQMMSSQDILRSECRWRDALNRLPARSASRICARDGNLGSASCFLALRGVVAKAVRVR